MYNAKERYSQRLFCRLTRFSAISTKLLEVASYNPDLSPEQRVFKSLQLSLFRIYYLKSSKCPRILQKLK